MNTKMKKTSRGNNQFPKKSATSNEIKPYSCQLCDLYASNRSSNLKRHKRQYLGDKPLDCCGQIFVYPCLYAKHKAIEHTERGYDCAVCKSNLKLCFNFKKRSSFERHMHTHSEEKPYPCPNCEYAATTKSNLKRHSKRHTNGSSRVTTAIENNSSTNFGFSESSAGRSSPENTSPQRFSPSCQPKTFFPVPPWSVSPSYKLPPPPDAHCYYGSLKI